jgi:hypothetical protein
MNCPNERGCGGCGGAPTCCLSDGTCGCFYNGACH